jgi:hypothetical protein
VVIRPIQLQPNHRVPRELLAGCEPYRYINEAVIDPNLNGTKRISQTLTSSLVKGLNNEKSFCLNFVTIIHMDVSSNKLYNLDL